MTALERLPLISMAFAYLETSDGRIIKGVGERELLRGNRRRKREEQRTENSRGRRPGRNRVVRDRHRVRKKQKKCLGREKAEVGLREDSIDWNLFELCLFSASAYQLKKACQCQMVISFLLYGRSLVVPQESKLDHHSSKLCSLKSLHLACSKRKAT